VESLLEQPASAEGFLERSTVAPAAQMMSNSTRSMLSGRRIGAYQVETLLGTGGMGEVYRARDTKLRRDVACSWSPMKSTAISSALSVLESSHEVRGQPMKKRNRSEIGDDLRPDYDLRQLLKGGVRGKYAKRYQAGTNLFYCLQMCARRSRMIRP